MLNMVRHCRACLRTGAIAVLLGSVSAATAGSEPEAELEKQVVHACRAGEDVVSKVAGVETRATPASPGDLPYVLVTDRTGASVRIYHDPALRNAAMARAACFGGLLAVLQPRIPDPRDAVRWAPMVLTRDPGYIPPRTGVESRWILPGFTGRWDAQAMDFLARVMPHEETHDSQIALRATKLPRWFQEGHAEWVGLQVTGRIRPDMAATRRDALKRALAGLAEPHLANWGGLRVKPEAMDRQLSPADRERRAKDPDYTPPDPFRFGPDDFVEDNSNEEGRYGAALALFDGLERRHGLAAVQAWVTAVLNDGDNGHIVPLAQKTLGEDIAPMLR